MALNGFIVLFLAGTLMFSSFKPRTFRQLALLAAALVTLPIAAVAIENALGGHSYWVSDLIFMRGGSVGIPVVFGYGLSLGLLLNWLRRLISGVKAPEQDDVQ